MTPTFRDAPRDRAAVVPATATPPSRRTPGLLAVAVLALLATPAAQAEPSPALDRISIWLGGYQPQVEGDLTLKSRDGSQSTGPQRVLQGDDTIYRARIDWLLFDSQGFSVDFFRWEDRQGRSVRDAFSFNGTTYAVDASLDTKTTLDMGNFSYRWWFGGGNTVFGVGLGAAYYKIQLDYAARASIGGTSDSLIDTDSKEAWAPLLTLGLRHQLTDQVRLYADVSGAKKNGGDHNGDIVNGGVGVEWFPTKNLGIGAEYSATRIRYNWRNDDVQAKLNVDLHGPSLYLRLRF